MRRRQQQITQRWRQWTTRFRRCRCSLQWRHWRVAVAYMCHKTVVYGDTIDWIRKSLSKLLSRHKLFCVDHETCCHSLRVASDSKMLGPDPTRPANIPVFSDPTRPMDHPWWTKSCKAFKFVSSDKQLYIRRNLILIILITNLNYVKHI